MSWSANGVVGDPIFALAVLAALLGTLFCVTICVPGWNFQVEVIGGDDRLISRESLQV